MATLPIEQVSKITKIMNHKTMLTFASVYFLLTLATSVYADMFSSPIIQHYASSDSKEASVQGLRVKGDIPAEIAELSSQSDEWNALGKVAMHDRSYTEAENFFRNSIQAVESNGEAYQGLAESLQAQGKQDDAMKVYQELMSPSHAGDWSSSAATSIRTLLPYALLLCKKGEWKEALAAYNEALPQVPGESPVTMPSPLAQLDSIHLQPALIEAAIHLAYGVWFNEQPDEYGWHPHEALAQYADAVRLQPKWDTAYFYYAYGLERLGLKTEAANAYRSLTDWTCGDVKQKALNASRRW